MLSHQLRYAATQEQMFLRENAVWITVQVAESAARSNGRTRPGNWLLTTGEGPRRQETIGVAPESRSSLNSHRFQAIRATRACVSYGASAWPKSAVIANGPRVSGNV